MFNILDVSRTRNLCLRRRFGRGLHHTERAYFTGRILSTAGYKSRRMIGVHRGSDPDSSDGKKTSICCSRFRLYHHRQRFEVIAPEVGHGVLSNITLASGIEIIAQPLPLTRHNEPVGTILTANPLPYMKGVILLWLGGRHRRRRAWRGDRR